MFVIKRKHVVVIVVTVVVVIVVTVVTVVVVHKPVWNVGVYVIK